MTIGHSTHETEHFIELLKMHSVTAICDVRSSPYSKFNPQFNRENIQRDLKRHYIACVYLGKGLGPHSKDASCYVDGKANYERIAGTDMFQQGLRRLKNRL